MSKCTSTSFFGGHGLHGLTRFFVNVNTNLGNDILVDTKCHSDDRREEESR